MTWPSFNIITSRKKEAELLLKESFGVIVLTTDGVVVVFRGPHLFSQEKCVDNSQFFICGICDSETTGEETAGNIISLETALEEAFSERDFNIHVLRNFLKSLQETKMYDPRPKRTAACEFIIIEVELNVGLSAAIITLDGSFRSPNLLSKGYDFIGLYHNRIAKLRLENALRGPRDTWTTENISKKLEPLLGAGGVGEGSVAAFALKPQETTEKKKTRTKEKKQSAASKN